MHQIGSFNSTVIPVVNNLKISSFFMDTPEVSMSREFENIVFSKMFYQRVSITDKIAINYIDLLIPANFTEIIGCISKDRQLKELTLIECVVAIVSNQISGDCKILKTDHENIFYGYIKENLLAIRISFNCHSKWFFDVYSIYTYKEIPESRIFLTTTA